MSLIVTKNDSSELLTTPFIEKYLDIVGLRACLNCRDFSTGRARNPWQSKSQWSPSGEQQSLQSFCFLHRLSALPLDPEPASSSSSPEAPGRARASGPPPANSSRSGLPVFCTGWSALPSASEAAGVNSWFSSLQLGEPYTRLRAIESSSSSCLFSLR